jgi:hypothetical protein
VRSGEGKCQGPTLAVLLNRGVDPTTLQWRRRQVEGQRSCRLGGELSAPLHEWAPGSSIQLLTRLPRDFHPPT